jgi:hypothetical protein
LSTPSDEGYARIMLRGSTTLKTAVDQISRIGIVVSDSFVGVGFSKPVVSGLEITEVMFGPFDLYPNPGEIGLAGHDQYNKGIMVSKRSKLP